MNLLIVLKAGYQSLF